MVLDDTTNCACIASDDDIASNRTPVRRYFPGEGLSEQHLALILDHFRRSFQELKRKKIEEDRIHFKYIRIAGYLSAVVVDGCSIVLQPGCRFHIRNPFLYE